MNEKTRDLLKKYRASLMAEVMAIDEELQSFVLAMKNGATISTTPVRLEDTVYGGSNLAVKVSKRKYNKKKGVKKGKRKKWTRRAKDDDVSLGDAEGDEDGDEPEPTIDDVDLDEESPHKKGHRFGGGTNADQVLEAVKQGFSLPAGIRALPEFKGKDVYNCLWKLKSEGKIKQVGKEYKAVDDGGVGVEE